MLIVGDNSIFRFKRCNGLRPIKSTVSADLGRSWRTNYDTPTILFAGRGIRIFRVAFAFRGNSLRRGHGPGGYGF